MAHDGASVGHGQLLKSLFDVSASFAVQRFSETH
jgi:hypothetical protein